jgi:PAS domain S-box-containing protein
METKLELTEQNYRYLFENASDAMWVHDVKGVVVDANKAFVKLTGYNRKKLIGTNVKRFLVGEKTMGIAREVRRRLLAREKIKQPYEQEFVRADGTVGIMEIASSLIIVNGDIKGFQHVARDITEEKSIEEMLAKITDGSPIPLFVIDKRHKITHWNTAVEALTGINKREMVGTDKQWRAFYNKKRVTMADLIVDGASVEEIEAHYPSHYKESPLISGAHAAEDFFPALGEHGRWLLFTASPIKSRSGEIIAAIETLQDVTEEKQLEENRRFYVQQITRAQEDERKRIARELHDEASPPLLLIIQRIDAITSGARPRVSKPIRDRLEALRRQAVEALEGLRNYAQDLRPRILDDLGLLPALEWMSENLEKEHGIDAYVEVSGDERSLPDEVQLVLFRIAQEALTNIRRHSRASRAKLTLKFGDKIALKIEDNGRGFELPQRIGDLASAGRLGLAGMQERAQLIEGILTIQSEPGKGTTVSVEVPLAVGKST